MLLDVQQNRLVRFSLALFRLCLDGDTALPFNYAWAASRIAALGNEIPAPDGNLRAAIDRLIAAMAAAEKSPAIETVPRLTPGQEQVAAIAVEFLKTMVFQGWTSWMEKGNGVLEVTKFDPEVAMVIVCGAVGMTWDTSNPLYNESQSSLAELARLLRLEHPGEGP
jgi:hypothetical protein